MRDDDERGFVEADAEGSEEEALLEELIAIVARVGVRRFVRGPLIEPTERCFPDPYTHDPRGVLVVARRLLAHLEATDLAVEVRDAQDADRTSLLERHRIELVAADASRLVLRVDELGPAETLPVVLAHRVVAAWRMARGLGQPMDTAFRGAEAHVDPELEPLRSDLTMFATGLGLLAVLGADHYAVRGRVVGQSTETAWAHERYGVLDGPTGAFLLAVQLVVRGEADARVAALEAQLGANARADLSRALEALRSEAATLRDAFGVTDALLAEGETPLDGAALEDDPRSRVVREARALSTRPVFRVRESYLGQNAAIGVLVGAAASIVAGWFFGPAALVLAVAGAGIGAWTGSRVTYDACSDPSCTGRIPEEAHRCPVCRRPVRGRIASPRDRLEAEERIEREDRALAEQQRDDDASR